MKKEIPSKDKIVDLDYLLELVTYWKGNDEKVVFTNGCFDLIHPGHVDYLERAKDLGDRLIIGLNTDHSVRLIKGKERPILDQQGRLKILAGLQCTDAVVLFNEETPYSLIEALKPDILVKGGDYLAENIVGADIVTENGGEVITLDLIAGYSTTEIINRIKND